MVASRSFIVVATLGLACSSGVRQVVDPVGPMDASSATSDAGPTTFEDPSCASATIELEARPANLYVLLDKSGSMDIDMRWTAVTGALSRFLASDAPNLRIGLGLFPLQHGQPQPTSCASDDDCFGRQCQSLLGCQTWGIDSCLVAHYQTPQVELGSIASVRDEMDRLLTHTTTLGGTPMRPAVEGALRYLTQVRAANPEHLTALVLATDGTPEDTCHPASTIDQVARDVAQAHAEGVLTFVVGIGDLLALDRIAEAGGTDTATLVDSGMAEDEFRLALERVRSLTSCRYPIPEPEADLEVPDSERINVVVHSEEGPETLRRASDPTFCEATAWTYDDPEQPREIILCPEACAEATARNARVEIIVGCRTIVI